MIEHYDHEVERKVVAILKVLSDSSRPLGSISIARELKSQGINLSDRGVRYHLRMTDERRYTQPKGKGRVITAEGREELKSALATDQVGFAIVRLESLAFQTSFDPKKRKGQVAVNTSLFAAEQFEHALPFLKEAFKAGLCVSPHVAVGHEGEAIGNMVVPKGKICLATISSITIGGALLKAGVPTNARFGGLLEIRKGKPLRFVSIITYAGSSLSPSEAYIKGRMTRVAEAARSGSGRILANFWEIPHSSWTVAQRTLSELKEAGLEGAILGGTDEPLCQVPVTLNRAGLILLGGLNPVAMAQEAGVETENVAGSGIRDFRQLRSIWDIAQT
jgi:hypothetical protein